LYPLESAAVSRNAQFRHEIVAEHFGFKAEHVAAAAQSTIRCAAGGTS